MKTIPTAFNDAIGELEEREAELRQDIQVIENRIAALSDKLNSKNKALDEVVSTIGIFQMFDKCTLRVPGLGKASARNLNFYRAWAVIQRVFRETYLPENIGRGVKQDILIRAVKKENPYLTTETVRSYLYQLRKMGHLVKQHNLWHLADLQNENRAKYVC